MVGNATSYLCWRERGHKMRLRNGAASGPWHQDSWDTGILESGKLPNFLWAPNWTVWGCSALIGFAQQLSDLSKAHLRQP